VGGVTTTSHRDLRGYDQRHFEERSYVAKDLDGISHRLLDGWVNRVVRVKHLPQNVLDVFTPVDNELSDGPNLGVTFLRQKLQPLARADPLYVVEEHFSNIVMKDSLVRRNRQSLLHQVFGFCLQELREEDAIPGRLPLVHQIYIRQVQLHRQQVGCREVACSWLGDCAWRHSFVVSPHLASQQG